MNRELLARVRDRIAEVGTDHCDMYEWAKGTITSDGEAECGTTACVAGWAIAVSQGSFSRATHRGSAADAAAQLLEVPSHALFYTSDWPRHHRDLLEEEGHAKAMIALCDDLIDGLVEFRGERLVEIEAAR